MALSHVRTIQALESAFLRGQATKHTALLLRLIRAGDARLSGVLRQHPLEDDWLEYSIEGLSNYFQRSSGFVYCAKPPNRPEALKVGKTSLSPLKRLDSLNSEAVIEPLELVAAYHVHDRHWIELQLHRCLKASHAGKEFFYTNAQEVQKLVTQLTIVDLEKLARFGYFLN